MSSALAGARARNPETVKPLLKAFIEKAELGADGKVKGLDEEVRKLSEGGDMKFLFEERGQAYSFKGLVPGEGGDREQAQQTFEDAVKAQVLARYHPRSDTGANAECYAAERMFDALECVDVGGASMRGTGMVGAVEGGALAFTAKYCAYVVREATGERMATIDVDVGTK